MKVVELYRLGFTHFKLSKPGHIRIMLDYFIDLKAAEPSKIRYLYIDYEGFYQSDLLDPSKCTLIYMNGNGLILKQAKLNAFTPKEVLIQCKRLITACQLNKYAVRKGIIE